MFWTPTTNISGALKVFGFVFTPSSLLLSSDSASNLLLCGGSGWLNQESFSLICLTFCVRFSGLSLGHFLYSTFCHGDSNLSGNAGKCVTYC